MTSPQPAGICYICTIKYQKEYAERWIGKLLLTITAFCSIIKTWNGYIIKYKISNTTRDTIIKTISKDNEAKVIKFHELQELNLEIGMKLIISGVDYITLEKID